MHITASDCIDRNTRRKVARHYGKPNKNYYWIYFIQSGMGGAVKIGKTAGKVVDRVASLQTATPERLKILSAFQVRDSLPSLEADLHTVLRDHHIRGEWFAPCQRVLDYAFLAKAGQGVAIIQMVAEMTGDYDWLDMDDLDRYVV